MDIPIVVLDNGASTAKVGIANGDVDITRTIPNAVVRSKGDKRIYFGHEGYIVDWDAQKAVWDGMFSPEVLGINPPECSLLITEPYFNLPNIQDVYDQFMFEEYEFQSYYRCTPASVIPHGTLFAQPDLPPAECVLVIDSGFSFTHVVPMINGRIIWNAVKRLDIGGKLLTNQLKELVSFRQWNMMDETYMMNQVKETCCYVSVDFEKDLEASRVDPKGNAIVQEYLLPDLSINRKGRLRTAADVISDTDQILIMNNERFTVPELIFHPDFIGLNQTGLSGTVAGCISLLPEDLQGLFWANIGLTGGNTKFPGFRQRLMSELRSLAPVDYDVMVYECDDPVLEAYRSAFAFASMPEFADHVVKRTEYLENGSLASRRKFKDWKGEEKERDKELFKGKSRYKEEEEKTTVPKKTARTKAKSSLSSISRKR